MEQYLSVLRRSPLFSRIADQDLLRMLSCLKAKLIAYEKRRIIFHQGDPARALGVVLSGSVHIVSGDISGNHALLAVLGPGDLFAESFACAGVDALPVSVVAAEDCVVLTLEHVRVITGCRNGCMAHSLLVTNLLRIVAGKNLQLSGKLRIVMQRTTREKLMTYLMMQMNQEGKARIVIPFDRQQLADYLGVERSALSAEIGKLRREGVLACRKSEFELLRLPARGMGQERAQ